MSGRIVGVLLVPADGDPHGLLADGPCGARVPTATQGVVASGRWLAGRYQLGGEDVDDCTYALVLAWDSRVVPEGVFRAWLVADTVDDGVGPVREVRYLDLELYPDRITDLVAMISSWQRDSNPLGRVVLVAQDGTEVAGG